MHRSIILCCAGVLAACGDGAHPRIPTLQDVALTTPEDTPLSVTVPLTAVYTVSDGNGGTATGHVVITVTAIGAPPNAIHDAADSSAVANQATIMADSAR